jgi:hypothetical protein
MRSFLDSCTRLAFPQEPAASQFTDEEVADSARAKGDVISHAFYGACRNGHTGVAELLLERGADAFFPNACDLSNHGPAYRVSWVIRRFSSIVQRRRVLTSPNTCFEVSTYPSWTLTLVSTKSIFRTYRRFVETVIN